MAKWRLYLRETRTTVIEIEAQSPQEGAKQHVLEPGKSKIILGFVDVHVDQWENITAEETTEEAVKKSMALDSTFKTN